MNRVKRVSRLWEEHGRHEHEVAVETRSFRRLGLRTKRERDRLQAEIDERRRNYDRDQRREWLEKQTRKKLVALARAAQIKGRTTMTKARLVEALL